MRLAISIPRSKLTPGMVRASAKATPSKVLWSSFLTMTSHGRPAPEPGPALRGFCFRAGGATVDIALSVSMRFRGRARNCVPDPRLRRPEKLVPDPDFSAPAAAARRADLEDVALLEIEAALGRQAAAVQAVGSWCAVLAAGGSARAVAAALGHEAPAAVGQHAVDAHHAVAAGIAAGPARPRPHRIALDPKRILALERLDRRVQRIRHRDVNGAGPGAGRPAALAAAQRFVVGEPRRPERDVVH